jgi:exopolyphosphatase/guanosine-5'-triphosphate,3'-diphosphate pyrophosphatase
MAKGLLPAAARIAKTELARAKLLEGRARAAFSIAVGGTWRNLARSAHDRHEITRSHVMHHYEMDLDEVWPPS